MRYYICPRIGDGLTPATAYRPDVPDGTSWVGNVGADGKYLVVTPTALPAKTGRQERYDVDDLKAAASGMGFTYEDVKTWKVG